MPSDHTRSMSPPSTTAPAELCHLPRYCWPTAPYEERNVANVEKATAKEKRRPRHDVNDVIAHDMRRLF
ncbi:hypothetical protein NDU88_001839 [Pleurodeles waltl]|uniref:Uncharacterized protein n=1 Tax=Pleurodeles waltl TaxID=8319 RepID=A0AAV7LH71_PLEWA|nr:hypothetical protein NDU88_001839 [Pleurodeles waltl]